MPKEDRHESAIGPADAWTPADALHYAHGEGIVRRDIKPANLIVGADTSVRSAHTQRREAAQTFFLHPFHGLATMTFHGPAGPAPAVRQCV